MPIIKYECEKCGSVYTDREIAATCEEAHGKVKILLPDEVTVISPGNVAYTYKRISGELKEMSLKAAEWKARYYKGESLPRSIVYTDDGGSCYFYKLIGDEE